MHCDLPNSQGRLLTLVSPIYTTPTLPWPGIASFSRGRVGSMSSLKRRERVVPGKPGAWDLWLPPRVLGPAVVLLRPEPPVGPQGPLELTARRKGDLGSE